MLTPEELAEANAETLECARYGEPEDLKELLRMGADPNYCDENGNTAMHKAAANGEVACLIVLKEAGSRHVVNAQGNLPIHWAAQNGKLDAVKYLVENYEDIDMLVQNSFGRSVLTEAFQSQNADVIEVCLSHPSASEDKLMPQSARNPTASAGASAGVSNNMSANVTEGDEMNESDADNDDDEKAMDVDESNDNPGNLHENAVYHWMSFLPKRKPQSTIAESMSKSLHISEPSATNTPTVSNSTENHDPSATISDASKTSPTAAVPCMRIRELPITRADNPFGSDTSPELDTTGLGIWPASVLAAKWVIHNRRLLAGKTVAELGAGCGLPGLAAAMYCAPKSVHITDIHIPTLRNAVYNVHLNSDSSGVESVSDQSYETECVVNSVIPVGGKVPVHVRKVDWGDGSTFPLGGAGAVDVLIGSDLVYEDRILRLLVPAVYNMLPLGGHFLYVAPIEGRQGMDALEVALIAIGFSCAVNTPTPSEFYANPLVSHSVAGHALAANTKISNDMSEEDDSLLTDDYILHFYDLSIQKPHFCYHFIKIK